MEIEEDFESLGRVSVWEFEICNLDERKQEAFKVHVCFASVDRAEDEIKALLSLSFRKDDCSGVRKLVLIPSGNSSISHHFVKFLRFDGVNIHTVFLQSVVVEDGTE